MAGAAEGHGAIQMEDDVYEPQKNPVCKRSSGGPSADEQHFAGPHRNEMPRLLGDLLGLAAFLPTCWSLSFLTPWVMPPSSSVPKRFFFTGVS